MIKENINKYYLYNNNFRLFEMILGKLCPCNVVNIT